MASDNKYFRKYDESQEIDFDDRQRLLQNTTTGNSILKEIIKGDPIKGVIKLVNTAKKFSIKSELSSILNGQANKPLDSVLGRLANTDNYKFQYGINDSVAGSKKLYKNFVDKIEDPTILTFTIEIDTANSPLFNYDKSTSLYNFIQQRISEFPSSQEQSLEGVNPIVNSIIGGLYDNHEDIWREFVISMTEFFRPYASRMEDNYSKAHYIESVSGIKELDRTWTGTGEDKIFEFSKLTFKMREDVKMSARNIYFLYNSLIKHQRSGKFLIPENLLRFNMWIKISEIRNFTSLRYAIQTGANQDVIDAIKRDVTSIYYYVQDCNFDFNKLHSEEIYSIENSTVANLEFDVIFRRAFRVFKPTLLKSEETNNSTIFAMDERRGSVAIQRKNYDLGNFIGQHANNSIRQSLIPEIEYNSMNSTADPIHSKTNFSNSTKSSDASDTSKKTQNIFQKIGKFLQPRSINVEQSIAGQLGRAVINVATAAVRKLAISAKKTITEKRNQLVRDLENKVKSKVGFGLPRPKNVYKPGEGEGVIGNTLESLSKSTGINFLAIREEFSIQNFNNTDVNTQNPALKGRKILTGPGGDYSRINPNSVKTSQEIGDVTPDSNFKIIPPNADLQPTDNYVRGKIVSVEKHKSYQELSGVNGFLKDRKRPDQFGVHDLHPIDNRKPDLALLKDIVPDGNDTKDLSLLKDIVPLDDRKPDLNLLNTNLQQGKPSDVDIKNLKDIVPDGNDIKDLSLLKDIAPDGNDIKNTDLLLKDNLQQGKPSDVNINDLKDIVPEDNTVNILKDKNVNEVANDLKDLSLLKKINLDSNKVVVEIGNDLHPDANIEKIVELSKISTELAKDIKVTLGEINKDNAKEPFFDLSNNNNNLQNGSDNVVKDLSLLNNKISDNEIKNTNNPKLGNVNGDK
jgi:uncharacterized FlaG/YvyC family protein